MPVHPLADGGGSSITERGASLLRTIADLVGTDVGTFVALKDAPVSGDGPVGDRHGPALLLRLVKTFRSLPTDENRIQALLILEAFGARINEPVPTTRKPDGAPSPPEEPV